MTSTPITAKRFLELCGIWSIKTIATTSNWATHNRNEKGPWGPVHGVMLHHTGEYDSVEQMAKLLSTGYASLPGPLCQSGIDPVGTVRLTGWGRCNHAGLGSESVLEAVKNSKYPPGNMVPGPARIDGNRHFYGFEIIADGITPITDAQRVTAIRLAAMLCTEHEWGPDVIGHGEWQQGKWDVGAHGKLIDFSKVRSQVEQAIHEGPPKRLPPRPVPPKPTTKTITVQTGDTFVSLARKYYGDSSRWIEMIDDNPQILQPGMKLQVPNKG